MCYSCSPGCDNCFAKFLECPQCGHIEQLAREACSKCGCRFTDDMRYAAKEEWKNGRRFAVKKKPQQRNLVLDRMIAEGKIPAPPGYEPPK